MSCDCWKLLVLARAARAGVHAGIAGRALGSISQRSLGDQAARIDRPEGNTGADGGVDGGMKLSLVIDAVEAQPAGEVDERLLLVQLAQHFGCGLQRRELAIGIEDVELAVILAKRGAGIGAAGVVDGLGGTLAFADDHGLENAEQLVAIGGEVLQNVDGSALVAEDGDQVDGCHLRAQELLRSGQGREAGRPAAWPTYQSKARAGGDSYNGCFPALRARSGSG